MTKKEQVREVLQEIINLVGAYYDVDYSESWSDRYERVDSVAEKITTLLTEKR